MIFEGCLFFYFGVDGLKSSVYGGGRLREALIRLCRGGVLSVLCAVAYVFFSVWYRLLCAGDGSYVCRTFRFR